MTNDFFDDEPTQPFWRGAFELGDLVLVGDAEGIVTQVTVTERSISTGDPGWHYIKVSDERGHVVSFGNARCFTKAPSKFAGVSE